MHKRVLSLSALMANRSRALISSSFTNINQSMIRSFSIGMMNLQANKPEIDVLSLISNTPFKKEIADILLAPLDNKDIEVLPEGSLFLPEIKYRRILNKAFLPGGWSLIPMGAHEIKDKCIVQEYALICHGKFVSQVYGEQTFDPSEQSFKTLGTALEGCKSNALMRCCKDLGIGSELWDPNFVREWKKHNVVAVLCENVKNKTTKVLYRRKDRPAFQYPYTEKQIMNQ
ncbi:hypothetical protein C9374_007635 [Naegleria lovaniensis]|uniref:Mitochondrial genome maintenance protein MGM101 n=1 Tax=Naegleria lovaniensis TaxID=51637 RepID=A0AA88GGG6_NAELO|nr:uncharacterized protein C9374_007635 [Naegleria lovaniensis]KAG2378997.1 hypothetical protein C9374_007635 [Naegleria lovaniensis]